MLDEMLDHLVSEKMDYKEYKNIADEMEDEEITGEKKVATNYEFTMEKDESTMEFINSDGKYFYFEK